MRCDTCKYYDYEGEYKKGYCSWYKAYYYADDRCSHWEEKLSSGTSGCFLTTACCVYKGLPDDCEELQTLRHFRDTYLKQQKFGREVIKLYYADAPAIVSAINASPEKDQILEGIYSRILEIIGVIRSGEPDKAAIEYLLMVYKLKTRLSA